MEHPKRAWKRVERNVGQVERVAQACGLFKRVEKDWEHRKSRVGKRDEVASW